MNKQELVDKVSKKVGLTKKDTQSVVDTLIESIMDTLKKGNSVTLVGFGSFKVVKRAARKGRNPQSGKSIDIPARKTPKFTPGKLFKEKVK
ncbi:MAG: HU family DNA-binding protein [Deferribacteraceae bacterium]|jgi:DNA-binding protein HU-beta|nr:HU family DNA-binding protein [Deferribacteraceae bacterium]